ISVQLNDVTRAVKHSSAVPAAADVLFYGKPQIRFDPTIKVVRNLAPDFFAVDYHGLVPFSNDNLLLQLPPSPGANRSRNISRARSKRVLTDARSEEHTSELQSRGHLVCRLLLEKKKRDT